MTVTTEHRMIATPRCGLRKFVRCNWIGAARVHPWARAKYERVVTVALLVQETTLAWALAEAVKPHLSATELDHVFMTIGAGDTFAAIRGLFKLVASSESPCDPIWCNSAPRGCAPTLGTRTSGTFVASSRSIWFHTRSMFRLPFGSTVCQP